MATSRKPATAKRVKPKAVEAAPAASVPAAIEPTVTGPDVIESAPAMTEPAVNEPAMTELAPPVATVAPTVSPRKVAAKKPAANTAVAKPITPKPAVIAPMIGTTAKPSKDTRIMTTTTATEYTAKMSTVLKDAQDKAKAAFEKNQTSMGEMGQFAKGNVEALVASTKILASGLQEMTKATMTEGKSAIETLAAEVKELTAAKSPTEFLELQTAIMRKQFDAMVAVGSKNSEAMLKLTTEAFQPISNRVSMAVEKIKHAA